MAAYTTIDDPEAYFQVELYTGTGSALTATFDGDTDMQPDLIWIKERSASDSAHNLTDSVRGAGKAVFPSSTQVEYDYGTGSDGTVLTFASDGFTLGTATQVNANTVTFVAWCWKESATSGFDMVGYEGTGSARTISHSLSAVPHLMIFKNRERAIDWLVYHHKNLPAAPETDFLYLSADAATNDDAGHFNDTAPTSSVFSVATAYGTNYSGEDIIAYLWSEKQGFSKFGSYEGNGNANGTFVYTGFRPAFIMTKSLDSTSSWHMFDNKRLGYNSDNNPLAADTVFAEATTDMIDILSNGFKLRISTDPNVAETYIYMAVAEAPFVNSNGVPCNAR